MTAIKKISLLFFTCQCTALLAMNIVEKPYKIFFNPKPHAGARVQLFSRFEYGFNAKAFGLDGERGNPFQIYQCNQDALAMLKGFCGSSDIAQLLSKIDASDNGIRGHLLPCCDITADGLILAARGYLPHNILLGFYLPIYTMQMKNVRWIDKTELVTEEDYRVKQYLTDDFANNVCRLGDLDIYGWRRTGLGDMQLIGEWWQDFPQYMKRALKNVRLNARFGLGLPTGKKEDENKLLAVPFGFDGAVSLLVAGALDLRLDSYFHGGFDVQLRKPFGNTRQRRIKTSQDQTDLLLLQKVCSYKDFGLEQQFILYIEVDGAVRGLSFKLGYQYLKNGEDTISLLTNDFSTRVANSGCALKGRTIHSILGMLSYTGNGTRCWNHFLLPMASLIFDAPFNGRRSFACPMVGLELALDF